MSKTKDMLPLETIRKKGYSTTGRAALAPASSEEAVYAESVQRIAFVVEQRSAFAFLQRAEVASLCGLNNRTPPASAGGRPSKRNFMANSPKRRIATAPGRAAVLPSVAAAPLVSATPSSSSSSTVIATGADSTSAAVSIDNIPVSLNASGHIHHLPNTSATNTAEASDRWASGGVRLQPLPGGNGTGPRHHGPASAADGAISNQLRILEMVLDGQQLQRKEQQYQRLAAMLQAQRERDEVYMALHNPLSRMSHSSSSSSTHPAIPTASGCGHLPGLDLSDLSTASSRVTTATVAPPQPDEQPPSEQLPNPTGHLTPLDHRQCTGMRLNSPIPPVPSSDHNLDAIGTVGEYDGLGGGSSWASSDDDNDDDDDAFEVAELFGLYAVDREALHLRGQLELEEMVERRGIRAQLRRPVAAAAAARQPAAACSATTPGKLPSSQGRQRQQHHHPHATNSSTQQSSPPRTADASARPGTISSTTAAAGGGGYGSSTNNSPQRVPTAAQAVEDSMTAGDARVARLLQSTSEGSRPSRSGSPNSQSAEVQTVETLHNLRARDLLTWLNEVAHAETARRDAVAADERAARQVAVRTTAWSTVLFLERYRREGIRSLEAQLFMKTLVETSGFLRQVDTMARECAAAKEMFYRSIEGPIAHLQGQWRSLRAKEQRHRHNLDVQVAQLFRRTFVRFLEHIAISEQRYAKYSGVRLFLFHSFHTTAAERQLRLLISAVERIMVQCLVDEVGCVAEMDKFYVLSVHEATSIRAAIRLMGAKEGHARLSELEPAERQERRLFTDADYHVRVHLLAASEHALAEMQSYAEASLFPLQQELERRLMVEQPEYAGRAAIERDADTVADGTAYFFTDLVVEHRKAIKMFVSLCEMNLSESEDILEFLSIVSADEKAQRQHIADEEDEQWYIEFELVLRRLVRVDTIKSFIHQKRLYEKEARIFVEHECFYFYVCLTEIVDQLYRIEDIYRDALAGSTHVYLRVARSLEHLSQICWPEEVAREAASDNFATVLSSAVALFHRSAIELIAPFEDDMQMLSDAKQELFDTSCSWARERETTELAAFASVHQLTSLFAASFTMLTEPHRRFIIRSEWREAMLEFTCDEESTLRYWQAQFQRRMRTKWIVQPCEKSHLHAEQEGERHRIAHAEATAWKTVKHLTSFLRYVNPHPSTTSAGSNMHIYAAACEEEYLCLCRAMHSGFLLLQVEQKERRWIENHKTHFDVTFFELGQLIADWGLVYHGHRLQQQRCFDQDAFYQNQILDQIQLSIAPESRTRLGIVNDCNGVWFMSLRFHRWFRDALFAFSLGLRDHEMAVGHDAATQGLSSLQVVEDFDRTTIIANAVQELKRSKTHFAKVFAYMHDHDSFTSLILDHRAAISVIWKEETAYAQHRLKLVFQDLPNMEATTRLRRQKEESAQRLNWSLLLLYWIDLEQVAVPLMDDANVIKASAVNEFRQFWVDRQTVYSDESRRRMHVEESLMNSLIGLLTPARRALQLALNIDQLAMRTYREAYHDAEESVLIIRTRLLMQPRALRINYFAIVDNSDFPVTVDLGAYDGETHAGDDSISLLVTAMRSNTKVKHLQLAHLAGHITPQLSMPLVTSLSTRLLSLDLSHCSLGDADLYPMLRTNLKESRCALRSLSLHGNNLSAQFARELISLARNSLQLHMVTLFSNSEVSKPQCDVLTYYCDLNKEGKCFKELVLLVESDAPNLTAIGPHSIPSPAEELSSAKVSLQASIHVSFDEGDEADDDSTDGKKPSASKCAFSDNRLRLLAVALCTNKHITELDFTNQNITDNGAVALAKSLRANAAIGAVDFSFNQLTNSGCQALEAVLDTQPYRKPLFYHLCVPDGTEQIQPSSLLSSSGEHFTVTVIKKRDLFPVPHDAGFVLGVCGNPAITERRFLNMVNTYESYERTTITSDEEQHHVCLARAWDTIGQPVAAAYLTVLAEKEFMLQSVVAKRFRQVVQDVLLPVEGLGRREILELEEEHRLVFAKFWSTWLLPSGNPAAKNKAAGVSFVPVVQLIAAFVNHAETWYTESRLATKTLAETQKTAAVALARSKWEPTASEREVLRVSVDGPEQFLRVRIQASFRESLEVVEKVHHHFLALLQLVQHYDAGHHALLDAAAVALNMEAQLAAARRSQLKDNILLEETARRGAVSVHQDDLRHVLQALESCFRRHVQGYCGAVRETAGVYAASSDALQMRLNDLRRQAAWEPNGADRRILRQRVDDPETEARSAIVVLEQLMCRTGLERGLKYVGGVGAFEKKCLAALQLAYDRSVEAVHAAAQERQTLSRTLAGSATAAVAAGRLAAPVATEVKPLSPRKAPATPALVQQPPADPVTPATEPRPTRPPPAPVSPVPPVQLPPPQAHTPAASPAPLAPTPSLARENSTPAIQLTGQRSPSNASLQSGSNSHEKGPGDRKIQQALQHLHTQPWDLQSKGKALSENDASVVALDVSYAGTNPEEPPCTQDTVAILYALTRRNRHLAEINISGNKTAVTARSAPLLLKTCAQTHVRTLALTDCGLRDEQIVPFLTIFLGLPECHLTALILDKNEISAEGAATLCKGLRENTTVTTFRMSQNAHPISKVTTDFLGFYVGANKYGEVFKLTLKRLENPGDLNNRIVTLTGPNSATPDRRQSSPQQAGTPKTPGLDDMAMKLLCIALSQNKTTEQLLLSGNSITDKGAKFLAFLAKQLPTLKILDVSSNEIGEAGGKEFLAAAQIGRHIQDIRVQNNPQMTPSTRRLLAAQLQQNANKGSSD